MEERWFVKPDVHQKGICFCLSHFSPQQLDAKLHGFKVQTDAKICTVYWQKVVTNLYC